MDRLENCLEDVKFCAYLVGNLVIKAFYNQSKNVTHKSVVDLVTDTDKEVEQSIINYLQSKYPNYKILAEESVTDLVLDDNPTWIIDPIDGTTNFTRGIPLISICIGLVINKEPVLGVVYNPILNELYSAIKNKGAFLNDYPIKVSTNDCISKAIINTNVGYDRSVESVNNILSNMKQMLSLNVQAIRSTGSAAVDMCWVATGKIDSYYEFGIQSWDIAAATVIVREAGGIVTLANGNPLNLLARSVLASNNQLHKKIVPLITVPTKFINTHS